MNKLNTSLGQIHINFLQRSDLKKISLTLTLTAGITSARFFMLRGRSTSNHRQDMGNDSTPHACRKSTATKSRNREQIVEADNPFPYDKFRFHSNRSKESIYLSKWKHLRTQRRKEKHIEAKKRKKKEKRRERSLSAASL